MNIQEDPRLKYWDIRSSELVFDNKWFRVRKDHVVCPNGKVFDDYYYADMPNYVNVIAMFDNGDILVERQYKHAARVVSLETIAGIIEKSENPLFTAEKELMEETGYGAEKFEIIGKVFENPTKSTSATYLILATGLQKINEPKLDYNESDLVLDRMPLKSFINKILAGEVFFEPTICAAFMVGMKLGIRLYE